MGNACGAFSITLLPWREVTWRQEAGEWFDTIEANDFCEISMWVPPRPKRVIMRGLIDSVGDALSLRSNVPQHAVTVTGRDFGKIGLITKLYYIDKKFLPENVTIFQEWVEGERQISSLGQCDKSSGALLSPNPWDSDVDTKPIDVKLSLKPTEIMQVIYKKFYRPSFDAWAALMNGTGVNVDLRFDSSAAEQETWEGQLRAIAPHLNENSWVPLTEVWNIFRNFQHAPWRELYWDDDEQGQVLTYRPTPWIDQEGVAIQPVTTLPERYSIPYDNVIEHHLTRSDDQVYNFFITIPWLADFMELAKSYGPYEGMFDKPNFESNPWLVGLTDNTVPSAWRRYGIRVMEVRTPYLSLDPDLARDGCKLAIRDLRTLGTEGNSRLKRAYDHGELLEFGPVTVMGDERIRIGGYAQLFHDRAELDLSKSLYYIEGVSQIYRQANGPDGSFNTHLILTRGRGHLNRVGTP
jgi:hypothetical protein